MKILTVMAVLTAGVLALGTGAGMAQSANPFGAPAARDQGAAAPSMEPAKPGIIVQALAWIYAQQQRFHRALTGAVKRFKTDPAALWLLLGLSFSYGVFHAAGPGHGKAVLSSYMLANEHQVRRGIVLAFAAAVFQALTAIALVAVLAMAVRTTGLMINKTANYFEMASYAMVVAIGLWLVWVKGRHFFAGGEHAHSHGHSHDHGHGHELVCADHGHAHVADPAQLTTPLSLSRAASLVVAMGLRPCTGAILVLLFTFVNGIFVAGMVATFAMALGTGLTVAFLAALALGSKRIAVSLLGSTSPLSAARTMRALEVAGALLVLAFGATLLAAAISAGGRPF